MKQSFKGAILYNGYNQNSSIKNQIFRLCEEFAIKGIVLDVLKNTELLAFIDNNGNLETKYCYDFIIFLDKDRHLAHMLEKSNIRLFNSSTSIDLCDDKMITYITLCNCGIKIPKTLSSPLCYTGEKTLPDIIKNVESNFSYPFIIKENYGSLGKEVYLIHNNDEFLQKERELQGKAHLFQEFVSESSGHDYRVIVIGNKVFGGMERINETSYLANISAGGKGYLYEIGDEMAQVAIKISKLLKMDYCGIDFVINKKNEPIFIECNSNAFFKEFESVTHLNVAKKYCEYIINEMKMGIIK